MGPFLDLFKTIDCSASVLFRVTSGLISEASVFIRAASGLISEASVFIRAASGLIHGPSTLFREALTLKKNPIKKRSPQSERVLS